MVSECCFERYGLARHHMLITAVDELWLGGQSARATMADEAHFTK